MSTILIVDDEPTARETLVAMLEGENYELQLAKDGFQALQMLQQLQPDLILLDVMMPGMDGFEVCRRIRSMPELAEVPIIILTALDDRESMLRHRSRDDFLSKPTGELTARVDGLLNSLPHAAGTTRKHPAHGRTRRRGAGGGTSADLTRTA
jgi:CheY-like chemotaxis protein